jgi:short chain dehydrogenase
VPVMFCDAATGASAPRRTVGAVAQTAAMDLAGATALVTGGADGIGAGITKRLAAEGMRVVVADLDQAAGEAMAGRTGGSFIRADVATEAGVRTAPAWWTPPRHVGRGLARRRRAYRPAPPAHAR